MFTEKFMREVEKAFEEQKARLGACYERVEHVLQTCSRDEAEALKCLYASMPISDAVDYPPELYLDYARHGVFLWYEGPFAGKIPEEIFAGYVLHHRVNNEDLTSCRTFFYEELKDEVQGRTMSEAVLRVNYWCAKEATYRTTDNRTAGAECVYRSAYGRCGEESTFAATVLRSLGIPARQVYVPLWSHCDDNHAWVEVWCDGTWKFFGACEPEEVLNKGWFTNASSRAMMVHSRWLLPSNPGEAVVGRRGMSVVTNQLKTYAKTTDLKVTVFREDGTPASGAELHFEVLNYSHFGEIASVYADEHGEKTLETGLGTIHVTAYQDGGYAEMLVNTEEKESCVLRLGQAMTQMDVWEEMVVKAPKDSPLNRCVQSEEEIELGRKKLQEAVALRLKKEENFYDERLAKAALQTIPSEFHERCEELMRLAKGNQRELADFLQRNIKGCEAKRKLELLNSLREKDYLDITADILEEHCMEAEAFSGDMPEEIFTAYVLCPRVDNEMIRPFRAFLLSWLSEEQKEAIRTSPKKVWAFVKERLKSDEHLEYGNLITSAEGALLSGYGSMLTKRVVSVQILRSLGIPSRLNPSDRMLEVWRDGAFEALEEREGQTAVRTASIRIEKQDGKAWLYYQNWSLARFEEKGYQTLELGEEGTPVYGEIPLFPGSYKIVTANRLPNGNIFAKQLIFDLKDGEKKKLCLEEMEAQTKDMLEENDITDFHLRKEDGSSVRMSELVREEAGLFIWLEEGKEPTEHILNEIRQRSGEYDALKANLYFVMKSEEVKKDVTFSKTFSRLKRAQILFDEFGADMEVLARRMYLEPGKLPLIVIVDRQMRGIYGVAGYNVGTADMILKILNLSE